MHYDSSDPLDVLHGFSVLMPLVRERHLYVRVKRLGGVNVIRSHDGSEPEGVVDSEEEKITLRPN